MTDTITFDIGALRHDQVATLLELVEQFRLEAAAPPPSESEEVESTGWTYELVEALRTDLAERNHHVQHAVLNAAIYNGGFVTRADVYLLGGYAQTRRLTRWTVPVKNAQDYLVGNKGLKPTAVSAIEPVYPPGSGYKQALGFRVPAEIVQLVWNKEGYDGTEVGSGDEDLTD